MLAAALSLWASALLGADGQRPGLTDQLHRLVDSPEIMRERLLHVAEMSRARRRVRSGRPCRCGWDSRTCLEASAWPAFAAVGPEQTGVATGMNILARTVGGSLGGQVAASVLAANTGPHGLPTEHGFTVSFVIGAIGLAASFVASLAIPATSDDRRQTPSTLN
jgi:hypothetical protein